MYKVDRLIFIYSYDSTKWELELVKSYYKKRAEVNDKVASIIGYFTILLKNKEKCLYKHYCNSSSTTLSYMVRCRYKYSY